MSPTYFSSESSSKNGKIFQSALKKKLSAPLQIPSPIILLHDSISCPPENDATAEAQMPDQNTKNQPLMTFPSPIFAQNGFKMVTDFLTPHPASAGNEISNANNDYQRKICTSSTSILIAI